jgi:hypothetical protein
MRSILLSAWLLIGASCGSSDPQAGSDAGADPDAPTTDAAESGDASNNVPRIIAFLPGQLPNGDELLAEYVPYITSNDFVFPISGWDQNFGDTLPGSRMRDVGATVAAMETTLANFPSNIEWAVLDLECESLPGGSAPCTAAATTCDDNPGSLAEYCDYVNTVRTASEIAHRHGLKLALTPLATDIERYSAGPDGYAPHVDLVHMQMRNCVGQGSAAEYRASVEAGTIAIRAANPQALVTVQLHPVACGTQVNDVVNGPAAIIEKWNAVKDIVDGAMVFHFSDPDPVPMVSEFLAAMRGGN